MESNLWKCLGLITLSCLCFCESAYLGKQIGQLNARGSNIAGEVYAVDSRTLHIRGLEFDGQDPDAVFFAGSSPKPSADGFVVPSERGTTNSLARYNGEHVTLTLPEGKTLKDVRWISVWSRSRGASLADVKVPTGFDYPKPQKLSALNGEHLVGSDRIVVVDAQTFLIPNFTYDGSAPDALFWVGKGDKPSADGTQIPDENGNVEPLKRYDSKTLVLTLPGDLTVFDINWLSIWCRSFFVDFGHIRIPKKLNVPPSLKMLGVAPQTKLNCEVLFDELALEVRWALAGESIVMQLVGKLEDNQYMSFGLSGNTNSNRMVGGDVIVAWYDRKTGKGHAEDYFLGDKSQCAGNAGVCPDTALQGGSNNVRLLNTAVINDFVMVTYQRPLRAVDSGDRQILTNQSQAIIWALGPLNSQGRASYHRERSDGTTLINFGRQPFWNCPYPEDADTTTAAPRAAVEPQPQPPRPQVVPTEFRQESRPEVRKDPIRPEAPVVRPDTRVQVRPESPVRDEAPARPVAPKAPPAPVAPSVKPWFIPPIPCHEPEDHVFYVHIGPTGGDQGYSAITGHVGWGIAWYVNGLLIPEITVVRGTTYNFVVEGGNDAERPAKNHPFYITDDPEGGYAHKTPEERGRVKIFAGVRYTREGKAIPTGTGRLCEWQQTTKDAPEKYTSFGAYQRTLKLNCEEGQPAIVKWRPDEKTPDTVYYQCFTHRYLGYRIRVVDRCDTQLQNRRVDATNGQQDLGEEDYDGDFEVDPSDPLRVGQSQNRPSKPSQSTHSKAEQFPGFDQNFPEFPSFGDFSSDFDELGKDNFFGREQAPAPSQDAPSPNDLPILRPGVPKPPPLQKVPQPGKTSERPLTKAIGELPLAEPSRPPPSLPPFSSPKTVDKFTSSTEKIQDERYKKYNMQIDKTKVSNFEEPAYDDDESEETAPEPPKPVSGYNARPRIEPEPQPQPPRSPQYQRPKQQSIAPSAVDTSFNPSSIVFESGFKPIKNANGPIPPLGFEVSDQTLAGSIRKTVEPAVKTEPFSLDPVFKASELETIRKDGTVRNVPAQEVTEGRPQFIRDRETFRLDAVPPPAQVNFKPERPAGDPIVQGFLQGPDGKYYLTANQPGQLPPRPNGVQIIERPVKRKETKKPSFFESVGSFFGFGADKRQDGQQIPPLPPPRPGVQKLPQPGEFLPPPPRPVVSQPNPQILQRPQLVPFKGDLPPPVPVNPGNLPQFVPQPGRPLSVPRPPTSGKARADDEVYREFTGDGGFSQVMNAKISFGGNSASHRGTVEDVRIAARSGLPFSRSINLENDDLLDSPVIEHHPKSDYAILDDVMTKIKKADEGPEELFSIKDREERTLRVRRQADDSKDLPAEHRTFDYDVDSEVPSETTTTTTAPSKEEPRSSSSLRSLSLLVFTVSLLRTLL